MMSTLRKFGIVAALALAAVYAAVSLRGPQGIPALLEKQKEIRDLQEQNATLARENQRKRERIQRLRESPSEQEMEIRKQLKLLRPGETSFILPEPSKDDVTPSPAQPPAPPASPAQ